METQNKFHEVVVQMTKNVERPSFYCRDAKEAVENLGEFISNFDREYLVVINCDSQLRPINYNVVSIGDATTAIAHPREILKSAVLSNAYAMIMMHNHVNKDVEPSKEDIKITNRMIKVCNLINIPLLDHVIVTRDLEFFSFRENDKLKHREFYCSEYLDDVHFIKPTRKSDKLSES